jgi:hypothetical protein
VHHGHYPVPRVQYREYIYSPRLLPITLPRAGSSSSSHLHVFTFFPIPLLSESAAAVAPYPQLPCPRDSVAAAATSSPYLQHSSTAGGVGGGVCGGVVSAASTASLHRQRDSTAAAASPYLYEENRSPQPFPSMVPIHPDSHSMPQFWSILLLGM